MDLDEDLDADLDADVLFKDPAVLHKVHPIVEIYIGNFYILRTEVQFLLRYPDICI